MLKGKEKEKRLHFQIAGAQGRRHHFPSFLAAVQTALRGDGDPLLRIIGSTAKVARKVRGREGGVGTEGRARNDYYLPSHAGERNGKGSITPFSPARKQNGRKKAESISNPQLPPSLFRFERG